MEGSIDPLLTVAEVAKRFRKSEKAMRYLIHTGAAPKSALVGGRRMFRESDVEAHIAAAFDTEPEPASA